MRKKNIVILGAAGRDFHNFNLCFRDQEEFNVIAFTATQIPDISGRRYPTSLANGKKMLYPKGIPILDEADLPEIIKKNRVEEVFFSYSDVSYQYVMNKSALVNALGADFTLLGYDRTSLASSKPVISICAVRTGCGKSQTARYIYRLFREMGKKVVAVRHPMPYGDLEAQRVQRFAALEDLEKHKCTIEEMEEYEPHIAAGNIIYSGVDYGDILREAEKEGDIILWDGGNNDLPFYKSDLKIVVTDPLRQGHEVSYYPGEANLILADLVVINKMDSAKPDAVMALKENIRRLAPRAAVVEADSVLKLQGEIKGKKVLVVEDGPTTTHGGMTTGAAHVAAERYGAAEIIDPKPYAVGRIIETYTKYPGIGKGILPAMGYGKEQVKDLEETINRVPADLVLSGTPIDLARVVKVNKPIVRVGYELSVRKGFDGIIEKAVRERLFPK